MWYLYADCLWDLFLAVENLCFSLVDVTDFSGAVVAELLTNRICPPWPRLISDVGLELEGTLINCSLL